MMWEQRADRISALGMAFFFGVISTIFYYNIPHLWQDQKELVTVQTKTLPALASVAGCQEKRAHLLAGEQTWVDLNCPSVRSVRVPPAESPVSK